MKHKKNSKIDLTGTMLWQIGCKWRKQIENSLKEFNLTHPQFVILSNISNQMHQGVTQVEIAEKTQIDAATTSQIIRYLEKKAYIKRVRINGDERAKYPKITKKGEEVLSESTIKVKEIDQEFFIPIVDNLSQFLEYISKLNLK